MKNPYKVPSFDANWQKPDVKYVWWSWHPCYPTWSRSCWSGATIEEAWDKIVNPHGAACKLRYYHNKLIREGDGQFVEVADLPCREIEVWQKIARDENGWRKETDAKPIEGWDKQ